MPDREILYVINPNSSGTVTRGIDAAMDPLRRAGIPIRCLTLQAGPSGIESQLQADLVIAPLIELALKQEKAAGFVIACFGDPGAHALRDATHLPVVGIQEASVSQALILGQRIGVISILSASIPRHYRSLGAMGVLDRIAGDRALELTVSELADEERCLEKMIETGLELKQQDGANVLIMGCAGMAKYRQLLENAVGLPVVEPCQAAGVMALGQIMLKQSHRGSGHA